MDVPLFLYFALVYPWSYLGMFMPGGLYEWNCADTWCISSIGTFITRKISNVANTLETMPIRNIYIHRYMLIREDNPWRMCENNAFSSYTNTYVCIRRIDNVSRKFLDVYKTEMGSIFMLSHFKEGNAIFRCIHIYYVFEIEVC